MTKRRERLQIIHDILRVIMDRNGRIKPTHILYKSNLSSQMLNDYLKELIKNDFIIEDMELGKKRYSLTPKSRDYLGKYKVIIEFMNSFGLV